jgi:membrane protease YdiL (CAAX protease family)
MASLLEPARYLTADEVAQRPTRHPRMWTLITAVEVIAAGAAVLLDLIIPTLVLLAMAAVSVLVRRTGLSSLGFHRLAAPVPLVLKMLAFAAGWSLFQLAVTMPIANHVSGHKTDLSSYQDLQGNLGMLVGLLLLSWTLAAIGEELAYRGYLQTRLRELFGSGRLGLVASVVVSSLLFGMAHSEQGLVGVLTITVDALAFSVMRYRYQTLWACVLAHGFINTIGFCAFFFAGPIYGFW